MATAAARARRGGGRARAALRARLEARREEIEAAALTRVRAISDSGEVSDPAYAEGLRAAVAAAVSYGIETTGREGGDPPIPVPLLAQARMAARVGIPLDTVLRRYFAGYSLLGYFILEEASHTGIADGAELKRLLGTHAGIFDRLLEAVGEEHGREADVLRNGSQRRQVERIERLLAGEPVDTAEISYDFEGWHVGLVTEGPSAEQHVRSLAGSYDCRLLYVPRDGDVAWAWLGVRTDPDRLLRSLASGLRDAEVTVALGESGRGLIGFRLTHRQAEAALPFAVRAGRRAVRYSEVALLASMAKDDLLVTSLHELFLAPFDRERDGGKTAKETLRAYFSAGRSVSSAAAMLAVKRHTVTRRLRMVEKTIGRPIESCATEIESALRLERLLDSNLADEP